MKSLLGTLLILITSCLMIAQNVNLKGVVLDDATGVPIENVSIIVSESQPNFATDHSGYFELNLEVR